MAGQPPGTGRAPSASGAPLGDWDFRYSSRHRNVALANLRLAYGDTLDDEAIHDIARASLQHVTTLFVETLRLGAMPEEQWRDVCEIEGEEHLREALARGQGVVSFSGHLGNWEIGAVRLIQEGYAVLPLSRPPRSPRLARKFKQIRDRLNFPVIYTAEGMRGLLRALKNNCIVPVMPDRFARGQGVTVPFFGQPTHVWHTPALLASRAQCPVVVTHAVRRPDGTFLVRIEPTAALQFTADRDADLVANTARLMAILEQRVREAPEQYAWHYRLWRPEFEAPDTHDGPDDGGS